MEASLKAGLKKGFGYPSPFVASSPLSSFLVLPLLTTTKQRYPFNQHVVSNRYFCNQATDTPVDSASPTQLPQSEQPVTAESASTDTNPPAAPPAFSLHPKEPPTPKVFYEWFHIQSTPQTTHSVRVMTYNVLSSSISDSVADISYRRVPKEKIAWGWRGPRMLEQILEHSPDVLCMQEVDKHEAFFEPELAKHVRILSLKRIIICLICSLHCAGILRHLSATWWIKS